MLQAELVEVKVHDEAEKKAALEQYVEHVMYLIQCDIVLLKFTYLCLTTEL